MSTKLDLRQSVLRSALSMVGNAANDPADTVLSKIDAEIAKLFEDRNALLLEGGTIVYDITGTTVSFTDPLKLHINGNVAGNPVTVINLGSATRTVSASGKMIYAVVNRTATVDTVVTITIASPAVFTTGSPHNLSLGQPVYFTTTGSLPTGLTPNTFYYVSAIPLTTTYQVSATVGGASINTSGSQSSTHTMHTVGTATITDDASSLPVVNSLNQEVFILAKRVDALDATKRIYFRSGMSLNAGQAARLGASGSGSSAITVKNKGTNVDTAVSSINIVGSGTTATELSSTNVQFNTPGQSFGDMIDNLEDLKLGDSNTSKIPNQIADVFSSNIGTKSNLSASSGQLVINSGQTSGTDEVSKLSYQLLTQAMGVIKGRIQWLTPADVALTPSNTGNPVTMTFTGDITGIIALNKDIVLAQFFSDDGTGKAALIPLKDTVSSNGRVARLNVSSITYNSGLNQTTINIDNPNAYDLSLGISSASFAGNLIVLPFDYMVQTKSLSGGSYQAGKGMDLLDLTCLDNIGILGQNFLEALGSLTGSAYKIDAARSPNGTYVLVRILEKAGTPNIWHWFWSSNSGITFTHFSITKSNGDTGGTSNLNDEEVNENFQLAHPGNIIVANNGKAFSTYGFLNGSNLYAVKGVYTDLSIGSPSLSDTPALSSDAGINRDTGTAGFIFSSTGNNFSCDVSGDTADLSFISIVGRMSNNTALIRWYTSAGSVFDRISSTTYSHTYGDQATSEVTGTGSAHRTFLLTSNNSSNLLQYNYFDQGSGVATGSGNITSTDGIAIVDSATSSDSKLYILTYDFTSSYTRFFYLTTSGTPTMVSDEKIFNTIPDLYNGATTQSNENFHRTRRGRIVIDPSNSSHLIMALDVVQPSGSTYRSSLYEITNISSFLGFQINQTATGANVGLNDTSTHQQIAQTFVPTNATVKTIGFRMYSNGTIPSGSTITCTIQNTSSNLPNGTIVATATATYTASSIGNSSSGEIIWFNFSPALTLSTSTTYAAVLSPSYSTSASNYISLMQASSTSLPGGQVTQYNGSVWSSFSVDALVFEVHTEYVTAIGNSLASSASPFNVELDDQLTSISLSNTTNAQVLSRKTTVSSAAYRPHDGQTYRRSVGLTSNANQSTISSQSIYGYSPSQYDTTLVYSASFGNSVNGQQNIFTGVIDTTKLGEDRSGQDIVNSSYNSTPFTSDVSFISGQCASFNGSSNFIAYTNPTTTFLNFTTVSNPFFIEVEIKPLVVGGGSARTIFSLFDGVNNGLSLDINSSGFLSFYTVATGGGTATITASDASETTSYHRVRVTWDGITGKLLRSTTQTGAFVEVVSYSVQQTLLTTGSTGTLQIGAKNGSQFYSGKIGYAKYGKGSSSVAYNGYFNQAPLSTFVNIGSDGAVIQKAGTNAAAYNTMFGNAYIASATAASASIIDSRDLYLMYNDFIASANQGSQLFAKITMGKQSDSNVSSFLAMSFRGLY